MSSKSLNPILLVLALALLLSGAASASVLETAVAKGMPAPTVTGETCDSGVKCVDLMAGQYIDAGDVCTEIVDGELCVTYTTSDGWELDEYHLWIGEDAEGYPQANNGNPKLGLFPYSETGLAGGNPVMSKTVCVSPEDFGLTEWCDWDEVNMVAHAVVVRDGDGDGYLDTSETGYAAGYELEGKSWATGTSVDLCYETTFDAVGLDAQLAGLVGDEGLVNLEVFHKGGTPDQPYFRGNIDYDQDGTPDLTNLPFYCVDLINTIYSNVDYCALMISSYNANVGDLAGIGNEQNLDLANYVINNFAIGDDLGNGVAVSGGDIQRTLWALVFGGSLQPVGAYSSGPSNNANVNAMLAAAFMSGEDYEPPCDGSVAVILYPVNCTTGGPNLAAQALIAQALVTTFESACTDVCTICCD